jgi:hypothetical protein
MMNSNSASRIFIQNLFLDILTRIFLKLNVVELSVASMACKSWNEICRNPLLWANLDRSGLSSNVFNIPLLPGGWRGDLVVCSTFEQLQYKLFSVQFLHMLDWCRINLHCWKVSFFTYNCTQFVCYVGKYISPFHISFCSSP